MNKRSTGSKVLEVVMVGLVRCVFALERLLGTSCSIWLGGWLARTFGRFFKANRIALDNLRSVFPEKKNADLNSILSGAWDNLGRVGAEYAHLSRLVDIDKNNPDSETRCEMVGMEYLQALKEDEKPGILFAAHLGNWELLAVCAARLGLDLTSVFREPNDPAIARVIHEIRSQTMGKLQAARPGAAFRLINSLEKGSHLGLLMDQHFTRGVVVNFLGRPALTNPILAKLVRQLECPVHGARVVRLPQGRFRIEVTSPMVFERDHEGKIDIQKATQAMTSVIEKWILEHPEQWLWMHRRWRQLPLQQ